MPDLVPLLKALADPNRLTLLRWIHQKPTCVCDLMVSVELPQPTVSRQLALLRQVGWVATERQGQWVYYRLHPELPDWALGLLMSCEAASPALAAPGSRSCCDSD
jgi:ArsR family transcriptional regulator, arsenate/arsenite/antimonite-responsive transcriptional repressor